MTGWQFGVQPKGIPGMTSTGLSITAIFTRLPFQAELENGFVLMEDTTITREMVVCGL